MEQITADCSAFNMRQSRGRIDNIVLSSPKDALYAVSSDVKIKGGSFSSTQNAISKRRIKVSYRI